MQNLSSKVTSLLFLCSLLFLVGCGPDYKIVPVSGRITLDGKPLANATILTQPIGTKENTTPGPGSISETDDDGNYELEFQHEVRVGAVPGPVRVKIVENAEKKVSSDDTVARVRSKVPLDYQEGKAEHTIPEDGSDQMDFELESRRRRK